MATNRFRLRFPFWLDMKKPEEAILADQIEILKNQRSFAPTVRDGIRLIVDLRAGQLVVLFELFPWIAEALEPPAQPHNSDLERQIADLKQIILQQGSMGVPPAGYGMMKQIGAPPMVTTKTTPAADAGAIADSFLAFIQ
ncbi:MAG: hypothetical protein ABI690_34555 [Chloroflexota bacterium]